MKGNRHIVLPCDRKRIADELTCFLVGHVETKGTHREPQFVPAISRRPDRLDHVVNECFQLRLAECEMAGHWPRACIPMESSHYLKVYIFGFAEICSLGLSCRGCIAARDDHVQEEDQDRQAAHGKYLLEGWTSEGGIRSPEKNQLVGLFLSRRFTRSRPVAFHFAGAFFRRSFENKEARQQFGVAAKARDCAIAPPKIAMTDHPLNSLQSEGYPSQRVRLIVVNPASRSCTVRRSVE